MADPSNANDVALADARLLSAQRARRRMFVRGLSATFGVLTVLALVQMVVVHAPVFTVLASALALFGFAAAFWASARPSQASLAATLLLATMQVRSHHRVRRGAGPAGG